MTIDAIRKRYAANADADNPTYYCTLSSADVDALFAALDAERGKVECIREGIRKLIEEHEYSAFCMSPSEVAKELRKILKGEKG